ncbi:MAG: class I SAM-dependent methyltransferase [Steroidobacteraceae bacterium]
MSVTSEALNRGTAGTRRIEGWLRRCFEAADITIGGGRDWDPAVHDDRVYSRIATRGSLGLGESYMDGQWDCADLGEFFRRLITWRNGQSGDWKLRLPSVAIDAAFALVNLQTRHRSRQVIDAHYDLPAGLYEHMLGSSMSYSCAYWKSAGTLDEAQHAKLDLICRKLELGPGQRLLDLGCGFGSVSRHAAIRGLFVAEDLHNFGPDYAPTLAAWRANFLRHWDAIRGLDPQRFTERFRRMWVYYLECCRGAFSARNNHLWQLVMSGSGRDCTYQAVR